MRFRNLLLVCSFFAAALTAKATDYPEKLYLVGTMNNWTLPGFGDLFEVPSVSEGVYSATMDLESAYSISFKVFNTLSTGWGDASEYYGAPYGDTYSAVFKDVAASWPIAPGYGSGNFTIPNASSLKDAVITIDLKDNIVTVASENAPLSPTKLYVEDTRDPNVTYPLERVGDTDEFKGKFQLEAGIPKIIIRGDNDFLLGALLSSPEYLWADRLPLNYIMVMNNPYPLILGNWKGGELEVSANISTSFVTFNASTQPDYPEEIYMHLKGNGNEETVYTLLYKKSDMMLGVEEFSDTIKNLEGELKFNIEVPGIGMLYTDNEPVELWYDIYQYLNLSPEYNNYISVNNWEGGELQIAVSPGFSQLRMKSPTQPRELQNLYLIGNPTGWNINDDTMQLTQIDENIFIGEFEMPADPMFRFYTKLGDWDANSIGSQYDDALVNVTIVPGEELNVPITYGKGSWSFEGRPSGMMYMWVDLDEMKALFSDSVITGIEDVENDDVKVTGVVGGINVVGAPAQKTVIYDMAGRVVGIVKGAGHISVAPGVYLASGKKIAVF